MAENRFWELVVIICVIGYTLCFTGICKNATELEDVFCCANFENNAGVCTECSVGATSAAGGRCVPCREDRFGYKCSGICSCNLSLERCDTVNGTCIVEEADRKSTQILTSATFVRASRLTVRSTSSNPTSTLPTTTRMYDIHELQYKVLIGELALQKKQHRKLDLQIRLLEKQLSQSSKQSTESLSLSSEQSTESLARSSAQSTESPSQTWTSFGTN